MASLTENTIRRLLLAIFLAGLTPVDARAQATGPVVEQEPSSATASALDEAQPAVESRPAALRFDLIAGDREHRITCLLQQMTLAEKVGQLVQIYPPNDKLNKKLAQQIRNGEIGSVFYPGNASVSREAQRIATEESRLGIPLLVARDVVHGLRTVFPIPLGQAATWNPDLVEAAAIVAAQESLSEGINWTFAPMMDVCRDARWGRIAETLGEDPKLASDLAVAMVRGFQQEADGRPQGIAACAKHFVGYGFTEGGRDYNRVSVSQADLHNLLLPPFEAAIDAGCRTLMTSFSELNGVPGTAHSLLLQGTLKRDWAFSGFVVSDWDSISEMVVHGYANDKPDAAHAAMMAGVDMDMCSNLYAKHLIDQVQQGLVPIERIDDAVRRVIRTKVELAGNCAQGEQYGLLAQESLDAARTAVQQSTVLLKNSGALPLPFADLARVAVIGPMADAPKQQLGCWTLDGKGEDSITPLMALRDRLQGQAEVVYAKGAKNTFDSDESEIANAVEAARGADVALVFMGEDATLSGEARCRVSLRLPGVQSQLLQAVAETGTPTVLVLLSGRPLALTEEVEMAEAVLFAWHPGTMAGPGITDVLLGDVSPSGKLPVTFPRSVGQTPIYYSHSNTGRPSPEGYRPLIGSGEEDLADGFQYRSHYLDEESGPLFPFGYGLSYTEFGYSDLQVSPSQLNIGGHLAVSVTVANSGDRAAVEVVQLYTRDTAARLVRPVRELKAYRRVALEPGESKVVEFKIPAASLAYHDNAGQKVIEPGEFEIYVGGDSTAELNGSFELMPPPSEIAPHTTPRLPTAIMQRPHVH